MPRQVVAKLKPQLVRKRTFVRVQPTIKVVVKTVAGAPKVARLDQLKQRRNEQAQPPAKPAAARPQAQSQRANVVSGRNKRTVKRATKVSYTTRSISPESAAKIAAIRNFGAGKILLIVGNGPSISEVPLGKLRHIAKIDTLSVNKPDDRLWPTTHWTFFDSSQMRRHEALWSSYGGYIFNSTAIKKQKEKSMQFKNLHGSGFSRDMLKGLHIGRSSVYASLQIALWMGYDHIYIVGCDMNPAGMNGKLHFYGVNPDVDPHNRAQRFQKEAEHYSTAAKILTSEERSKFTFCTLGINPWPFMHEFNVLNHIECVDAILAHAGRL